MCSFQGAVGLFSKDLTSLTKRLMTNNIDYQSSHVRKNSWLPYIKSQIIFFKIWQPPTLPYRLQYSTIGRPGLNHRVRDGNGCVPRTHRHQKIVNHFVIAIKSSFATFPPLLWHPLRSRLSP